jgi:hypothetical protein
MVFTHKIYKLLEKTDLKKTIVAHDWWTYIIATYCGKKVYYDKVPYVLYRQHGKNINGHNLGLGNQIFRIYRALKGDYKKWINYNLVLLRDFDKYGVKKNKVLIKKFFQLRKKNIKLLKPIKILFFRKEIFGKLKLKLGFFLKKI